MGSTQFEQREFKIRLAQNTPFPLDGKGSSSRSQVCTELEFLKSLWGLGTEEE